MSPDPSLFCAPWEVRNKHRKTYRTNMIAEVALKGKIRMESSNYIETLYYIEIGIMRAFVRACVRACVCVCSLQSA